MTCPYCGAATIREQAQGTALGYRKFRCRACRRLFNERTGTPFNFLESTPRTSFFWWWCGGCATTSACEIWRRCS